MSNQRDMESMRDRLGKRENVKAGRLSYYSTVGAAALRLMLAYFLRS